MKFLVRRAMRGDPEAFIGLMEENKRMLYKVAKGYLSDEEDIADAMQETMLAAFEHIGEMEKPTCFKTWLTRILINKCTDILRDTKRVFATEEIPERVYFNRERNHLEFMQLLDMLPEENRIIFLLYYGEQFNSREIAEILDMNENTVKTRLNRGRKMLAHKLKTV